MEGRDLAVLAVAYRCLPGVGSEGGQAWAWASAAARRHRVWLVTRADDADVVVRHLEKVADERLRRAIVVVPVPEPGWAAELPDERRARLRYARWQLAVRETIRTLDRQVGPFDVAHHLTWACDWQPTLWPGGIPHVPLVWGPVGGGGGHAWRPAVALGPQAVLEESARQVLTATGRLVFGRSVASRAAVTVAANPYTASNLRRGGTRVVIEPGVALDPDEQYDAPTGTTTPAAVDRVAVYAGRLLRWKGVRFAIESLAEPGAERWRLDVYGEGSDERNLRALVDARGLGGRVRFLGRRPRAEVLRALTTADAFLFPSLHDSSGWAVAEALATGCPVICVDRGGPPTLVEGAGPGAGVVLAATRRLAADIGEALASLPSARPARSTVWSAERLPDRLDEVYTTALARSTAAMAALERAPTGHR